MSLPDWVAILSLVLSFVSIVFSVFAIYQSNESNKRAENLNKQTQDALKEISVCAGKIESIVVIQQGKQMDIIADTTQKLTNYIVQKNAIDIGLAQTSDNRNQY